MAPGAQVQALALSRVSRGVAPLLSVICEMNRKPTGRVARFPVPTASVTGGP